MTENLVKLKIIFWKSFNFFIVLYKHVAWGHHTVIPLNNYGCRFEQWGRNLLRYSFKDSWKHVRFLSYATHNVEFSIRATLSPGKSAEFNDLIYSLDILWNLFSLILLELWLNNRFKKNSHSLRSTFCL